MKKRLILLSFPLLAVIAGCKPSVKTPLEGDWISNCVELETKEGHEYHKFIVSYRRNSFVNKYNFYTDDECTTPSTKSISGSYAGTFTIGNDIELKSGVKVTELVYTFKEYKDQIIDPFSRKFAFQLSDNTYYWAVYSEISKEYTFDFNTVFTRVKSL